MSVPAQQDTGNSLMEKALTGVKNFGLRIVVHVSAFFCAGVVAGFVPGYTAAAMYVGLICLVARETRMHTNWLVPLGFGLGQVVLSLAFGLPLYQAIFWGGAQTWVQRLFMKRYALGTEWVPVVFLVPLAFKFVATASSAILVLGSFGALTVAGAVFWQLRTRIEAKKIALQQAREQQSVAAEERVRLEAVAKENVYNEYKASIAKLRAKQLFLPKHMQTTLQELIKSADAVVLCMKNDVRDKEPGEKFLARYLPATHSVVENYTRLAGSSVANAHASEDITAALSHTEEVLQRLAQAFSHEHKNMLRNDIQDFSADLKVLDTLLKMDGR